MAFGRLSDSLVTDWFDQLMTETWYVALFYSSPFMVAHPHDVELLGDEYNRMPYTQQRHAFNIIRNSNVAAFLGLLPGTHIEAVGVFTDDTGGHFRGAILLDDAVDLPSGGNYLIPENQFQFGIDVALGP